ncbi:MAG: ethanolamine ammonia-lyase [Verrucomicrobiota bacterium]|jgi:ethanolamine ammonia-lyase large subunit
MRNLSDLSLVIVPEPKPDELYEIDMLGQGFRFLGLKKLLGAADFSKAGDRHADLAAKDEIEREAARAILSSLTLQHLYDRPLTDDAGKIDSVMRVNYDIDLALFRTIAHLSVGDFKDLLLRSDNQAVSSIGSALTGVMAAAVAKLCDTHELIFISQKISRSSKARTTLGLPGSLSSRLQPNHPVDDLRGLTLLIYESLSLGAGDALIGVNPSIDTVDNISAMLCHVDKIRRATGAPTQICVLSHIKTQLTCLEQGVPVEIMFQSLAGTEATNLTEFDISVELIDHAYRTMARIGPLKDIAENFMYFETGQGSEFTYGKHNGIDMSTTEALCYGLARRWHPYMVNNVTGFIGPETHLDNFEMIIANLQDHFMGKLLGLPMGMAPCYTLHSKITLEGQQMATQMLTAAGANFYMDVYLNTDRMLAYFDTSGHDNQTLREIYRKNPTPEYREWALAKGIFAIDAEGNLIRGPYWGRLELFGSTEAEIAALVQATPATYGFDNAGPRPVNKTARTVRSHQALARAATYSELRLEELLSIAPFRILTSAAANKEEYLNSPKLGTALSPESLAALRLQQRQVQIVVSDGLSAEAIHHNVKDIYPKLNQHLDELGISQAEPLILRYGRVKAAEAIADAVGCDLVILLIGERPGGDADSSRSMSSYFAYRISDPETRKNAAEYSGNSDIRFEYMLISNIYSSAMPADQAARAIANLAAEILKYRAAGNRLVALRNTQIRAEIVAVHEASPSLVSRDPADLATRVVQLEPLHG